MLKKLLLGFLGLLVLGAAIAWFAVGRGVQETNRAFGRDTAPADFALQDDSRVSAPAPEPQVVQAHNPLKNVYWGDTHVHTHESFDAALFGTTLTIEDAYRFARGEALRSDGGERMQLSRPPRLRGDRRPRRGFRDEDALWGPGSRVAGVLQLLRDGDIQPHRLPVHPGTGRPRAAGARPGPRCAPRRLPPAGA